MNAWPQATNSVTNAMEGEGWDKFFFTLSFQWCVISGIFAPLPPQAVYFCSQHLFRTFNFQTSFPLLPPPPKEGISCDLWRGSYRAVFSLKLCNVSLICFSLDLIFKVHTKEAWTFSHSWAIKFVSPRGHVMICLFYLYWWNFKGTGRAPEREALL